MNKKLLLKKITASKDDIASAEKHLGMMMRQVGSAPRAEKKTVSTVVAEAIGKLNAARAELEALEKIVLAEE